MLSRTYAVTFGKLPYSFSVYNL